MFIFYFVCKLFYFFDLTFPNIIVIVYSKFSLIQCRTLLFTDDTTDSGTDSTTSTRQKLQNNALSAQQISMVLSDAFTPTFIHKIFVIEAFMTNYI